MEVPIEVHELTILPFSDMIGKYTEHIAVKNNVIEIKFAYDAHASIFNRKIKLTVTNKDGSIS